jgi:hypothetical protein
MIYAMFLCNFTFRINPYTAPQRVCSAASTRPSIPPGRPGTGKTRFVHQLAEALGLPLVEVRLPRSPDEDPILKRLGPQDFLTALSLFPTRDNNDPCEAVGVLACAMFEAEVLNPIIFVEEAGETLNQPHHATLLKDVLDPDNLVLRLRSLDGLQLDFSPSTVIFANNAPLTDAVLHTKLKQVIVARLTEAQKAQILADTLRGEVHGNNARLRTELRRKLEHAMGRLAPLLLDADASHDVPGARHLIRSSSRTHQVRGGATDHRRQCSSQPCTEADRGLVQASARQRHHRYPR